MMGTLYIVATPIGNLEDISIRAIKTLFSADLVLCEDTRRTGNLLHELEKRFPEFSLATVKMPIMRSYYDEIEDKRIPEVIELLYSGKRIALVSDNGTPLINDPGFRLVREAQKRKIPVSPIPGPVAAIAALSVSSLPTNTFSFLGFLPEREKARRDVFEKIRDKGEIHPTTHICYIAPHKLLAVLGDMAAILGNREIVLARELTKIHEEIWKGTILEAKSAFASPQGEFVLLFHL